MCESSNFQIHLIVRTLLTMQGFRGLKGLTCPTLLSLMIIAVYLPQVHAVAPGMQLDGVALGGSHFVGWIHGSFCGCIVATPALLSTTDANDVIVVVAQCDVDTTSCNSTITSVYDSAGHSWTLRAAYSPKMGRPIWEYYTVASSPLVSDQVNATWAGPDPIAFVVFAVNGANIQHPWDPRLPVEEAAGSNCVSPGPACDMLSFPPLGSQDFVIVSSAASSASFGYCVGDLPFRALAATVYGETDYLITNPASSNIRFSCDSYYGGAVTLLADALQSQTPPDRALRFDGLGDPGAFPCCSQLLTTTQGNDVVVLMVESFGPVSAIIDSSGLNFTQRISYTETEVLSPIGFATLSEYYARASAPLVSDNITVVGEYFVGMQALAIHGANTRAIFDPNPSIPSTLTCPGPDPYEDPQPCSASIQTSAIDFVIAATTLDDTGECNENGQSGYLPASPSPGFTNVFVSGDFEVDYSITTAPRSTVTFTCDTRGDTVGLLMDAISFNGAFGTG
jgi:hypothetical protein